MDGSNIADGRVTVIVAVAVSVVCIFVLVIAVTFVAILLTRYKRKPSKYEGNVL